MMDGDATNEAGFCSIYDYNGDVIRPQVGYFRRHARAGVGLATAIFRMTNRTMFLVMLLRFDKIVLRSIKRVLLFLRLRRNR